MASARPIPGYANVTVERDVPARMRDGVTLYADVYRPATPGRYPVILFRHPYDKAPVASLTYAHAPWYARHGYVVVNQDMQQRAVERCLAYAWERRQQLERFDGRLALDLQQGAR